MRYDTIGDDEFKEFDTDEPVNTPDLGGLGVTEPGLPDLETVLPGLETPEWGKTRPHENAFPCGFVLGVFRVPGPSLTVGEHPPTKSEKSIFDPSGPPQEGHGSPKPDMCFPCVGAWRVPGHPYRRFWAFLGSQGQV